MCPLHPGLSNIPAWAGGPGSDIIKLGITIGVMDQCSRGATQRRFCTGGLIMMSLSGPPTSAGIFYNPGCLPQN